MLYKIISLGLVLFLIIPIHVFAYIPKQNDSLEIKKISSILEKRSMAQQIQLIHTIETIKSSPRLSNKNKYIVSELENNLRNNTLYSFDRSEQESQKNIQKLNLDILVLQKQWIDDLNRARTKYSVPLYSYNDQLTYVSQLWSNMAYQRGYITHQVDAGDDSYDYWKKAAWAEKRGLTCKNKSRATFSESIAWGDIYCDGNNDCQKQFSDSLTWVYKLFMDEKGLPYPEDAHYRAIVHPEFMEIGLAFTLQHKKGNWYSYYMTNYYCTEIIN